MTDDANFVSTFDRGEDVSCPFDRAAVGRRRLPADK